MSGRLHQRDRTWLACLAFPLVLGSSLARSGFAEPLPVSVQSKATTEQREAKVRYDEGVAAYREGRFDAAIQAFLAAEALAPRAANAYNVARAYERLNETTLALEYYQHYLEREPKASNAGEVRDKIAVLGKRPSETKPRAMTSLVTAAASVANDDATTQATSGSLGEVKDGTAAPAPAPATCSAAPEARMAPPRNAPSRVVTIVGGALTLLGVSAGIAFEIAAEHEDAALREYRSELGPAACSAPLPPAECESIKASAERYDRDRTLALVGFATASTAAIGTFVYWLVTDSAAAASQGSLARKKQVAQLRLDGAFTSSGAVLGLRGSY